MPDSSNVITEIKISELPAASQANADDQLEANQAGTTRRITLDQVSSLVAASDQVGDVVDAAIDALSPLPAADGDGSGGGTNIVPSLQTLIDAAAAQGGGEVIIPCSGTGIYRWATTLEMKSNVTVRVAPGVKFDWASSAFYMMKFTGTIAAEVNTSVNLTRGQTVITCAAAHGGVVGDLFRIRGQRNALSSDAGIYQCGKGTGSLQITNFVEWLTIAALDATTPTTKFTSAQALTFPGYNISISVLPETDPDAISENRRTTVQKVTPCLNAHWIGGEIIGMTPTGAVANSVYAVDCTFEDATIRRGAVGGVAVQWGNSYRCETRRVRNHYLPKITGNLGIEFNCFKLISCEDCGIVDCYAEHAFQAIDFTYSYPTGGLPSDLLNDPVGVNLRPYAIGNTARRGYGELSEHPGVYESRWINNRVLDCFKDGIIIRGLKATVHGNLITSTQETVILGASSSPKGIELSAVGARYADIQHNTIRGFQHATYVGDGSDTSSAYSNIDCHIANNQISDCINGFCCELGITATTTLAQRTAMRGVTYVDNYHTRMGMTVVRFDNPGYCAGSIVSGNTLIGPFVGPFEGGVGSTVAYFLRTENSPALIVENNKWLRPPNTLEEANTVTMISMGTPSAVDFPTETWNGLSIVRNNKMTSTSGASFAVTGAQSAEFADRSVTPGTGGVFSGPGPMGIQTGYYTPTLTNTTNVASSAGGLCTWIKVGSRIMVAGTVQITATAASTITSLRVSLPIASDFTATTDGGGSFASDGSGNHSGRIVAEISSNLMQFQYQPSTTSIRTFGFTFMYQIN